MTTQNVTSDSNTISYAELFTQLLSDIVLEMEGMKTKVMKNDIQGINDHVERINISLNDIMETKLELAETHANNSVNSQVCYVN